MKRRTLPHTAKRPSVEWRPAPDEPVYTSGVVSRLLDIPVWVLKQLDREAVVRPTRKKGCSRLYSNREMQTLVRVWRFMRQEKVNVHGVKVIMRLQSWGT